MMLKIAAATWACVSLPKTSRLSARIGVQVAVKMTERLLDALAAVVLDISKQHSVGTR
jgi:hypothetical protein